MIRSTEKRDQMTRQSRAFKRISELNKKHGGDRKAVIKELMEPRRAGASLQPETKQAATKQRPISEDYPMNFTRLGPNR
jgi:hypothetical protein